MEDIKVQSLPLEKLEALKARFERQAKAGNKRAEMIVETLTRKINARKAKDVFR